MRRLRGIDDFPIVLFEHLSLLIGQTTLWIVQNQTWTQRGEGGVDVDRIRIAGEVDRMDPVIGIMPPQPFDALEVGRKAVLHHQIAAETQDVGGVE